MICKNTPLSSTI